jgi:uncharacterized protein
MLLVPNVFLGLALLLGLDQPVSKEDLRFRYVMEQGLDESCGMAVVASALSLYWGVPVAEAELLAELPSGSIEEGRGEGKVSLAAMAAAFEARGVSARGFRLDWAGLEAVLARGYAPLVVHYDRPDTHFALLLGISGGTAAVADPARGLEALDRADFEQRYSGAALALASRSRRLDPLVVQSAAAAVLGKQAALERAATQVLPLW